MTTVELAIPVYAARHERDGEADVDGVVVVDDDGHGYAVVTPGLPPDRVDGFASWAFGMVARLVTDGPAVDGWQARMDGRWQLWCRAVPVDPSLAGVGQGNAPALE